MTGHLNKSSFTSVCCSWREAMLSPSDTQADLRHSINTTVTLLAESCYASASCCLIMSTVRYYLCVHSFVWVMVYEGDVYEIKLEVTWVPMVGSILDPVPLLRPTSNKFVTKQGFKDKHKKISSIFYS